MHPSPHPQPAQTVQATFPEQSMPGACVQGCQTAPTKAVGLMTRDELQAHIDSCAKLMEEAYAHFAYSAEPKFREEAVRWLEMRNHALRVMHGYEDGDCYFCTQGDADRARRLAGG